MKKICFLIGCYNNGGGTERVTSQIANGLISRGYEISIISIEKGLAPRFETDKKIKLYELNHTEQFDYTSRSTSIGKKIKHRIWCFRKVKAIRKSFENKIREVRPDLVIAVDIECYRIIDSFRNKYRYKTIGWEHFSLLARDGLGVNYSRGLAIRHAAKVLVLSDHDLFDYQTRYPRAKNLMRMYNPLAFVPTHYSNMKNKVVIAAGRYAPDKNFDTLIAVWNKIADEITDWELRIFGDGEDRAKLQGLIEHYGLTNVKLMPYTRHLAEEMDKASIYALSSKYEGWGLVLVEAQARGLPCVSFNCKHGPSEIITDGINGFLVPPGDTEIFAKRLLELMKNEALRQSFSANAQKDLYKFEVNNVIDQWVEMLNTI